MSRRNNVELAGVSTPPDLRQELMRELAALESEQQQHDDEQNLRQRNVHHGFTANYHRQQHHSSETNDRAKEDEGGIPPLVNFRRALILSKAETQHDRPTSTSSPSSSSPGRSSRFDSGGLCLEGALADTELSTAKRMIAREETILRTMEKSERQKQRLVDQLAIVEERANWAMDLIVRQEAEARETLELVFASRFVETERIERARRQRQKVDAEVDEFLAERQVIDDLHNSMVEDRWLTRDQVLREAAAIREARGQVEREWRKDKEHVFLEEGDIFLTMN